MVCGIKLNARFPERGFTVVEVLLAIAVLAIIALGIVGVVPFAYKNTSRDSQRLQAVAAGQQYLDTLRQYIASYGNNTILPAAPAIPIDAGDTMDTGTPISSPGNFTITSNQCPMMAGSNLRYDCIVTVTWTQNGASRSLSVESYVTAQQ